MSMKCREETLETEKSSQQKPMSPQRSVRCKMKQISIWILKYPSMRDYQSLPMVTPYLEKGMHG